MQLLYIALYIFIYVYIVELNISKLLMYNINFADILCVTVVVVVRYMIVIYLNKFVCTTRSVLCI